MLPAIFIYATAVFTFDRTYRSSPWFDFRAITEEDGELLRTHVNSNEFLGLKEMGYLVESVESSTEAYKERYPGGYLLVYVSPEEVPGNVRLQEAIGKGVDSGKGPVLEVAPVVSGEAKVGKELSSTSGTWASESEISYEYQWTRGGVQIPGATGQTYLVLAADFGSSIGCTVRATNEEGTKTARSLAVGPVEGGVPVITEVLLSGVPDVGNTLTVSFNVEAAPEVLSVATQWVLDNEPIEGETGLSYIVRNQDVEGQLRCIVKATNAVGESEATSQPSSPVSGPPMFTGNPSLQGDALVGSYLALNKGSWKSNPAASLSARWFRDEVEMEGITSVDGYSTTAEDIGHSLHVSLTIQNDKGSQTRETVPYGPITGEAPSNVTPPVVTGTKAIGETLTATPGQWNGSPAPEFFYAWMVDGEEIPDEDENEYVVREEDMGKPLYVVVTATNAAGSNTAQSASLDD